MVKYSSYMIRFKHKYLQILLLFLAIGWFWSISIASIAVAESQNIFNIAIIFPERYLQNKLSLNKPKPITRVAAVKTDQPPKNIIYTHRPVLPPLKDRPYWPVRKNTDCSKLKCIALTFDDGPTQATAQLLDILKSKKSVATFFVVGDRVVENSVVIKRMITEKNEIGNHSLTHKWNRWTTAQTIASEINATQDIIFGVTGYRSHIFRPPYGNFPPNDPTIANYPIILWNNDPDDWKHRDSAIVDEQVMKQVKPGAIVVMHDIYPTSINAVPKIIDTLQAQGYTLVTISELFGWQNDQVPLPKGQILRGL